MTIPYVPYALNLYGSIDHIGGIMSSSVVPGSPLAYYHPLFFGLIGDYVFYYYYDAGASPKGTLHRVNYKTLGEDILDLPDIYGSYSSWWTNSDTTYIPLTETTGIFIINEYLIPSYVYSKIVTVYDVDFNSLTYSYRTSYNWSSLGDAPSGFVAVSVYGGTTKVVLAILKSIDGNHRYLTFVTYDLISDTFISLIGPHSSDDYYETCERSEADFYADFGNGKIAFYLYSDHEYLTGTLAKSYIYFMDLTTNTGSAVALPNHHAHNPIQENDYYYRSYGYKFSLAPGYSDGSVYFLCPFNYWLSADLQPWINRLVKIMSDGTITVIHDFSYPDYEYWYDPVADKFILSPDKLICCSSTTVKRYFYDVLNQDILFHYPPFGGTNYHPGTDGICNKLDADGNMVWIEWHDAQTFYDTIFLHLEDIIQNDFPEIYENGWSWSSWDIEPPNIMQGVEDDGIVLRAEKSDDSALTWGNLLWSGSVPGNSSTGVTVTYPLEYGQRYMVTTVGEFRSDLDTDTWATLFAINLGPYWVPPMCDYFCYGYGQEAGITKEDPAPEGYIDTGITEEHGNHPAKLWFYATSLTPPTLTMQINEGDVQNWRGDNDGTLGLEVYDANLPECELSLKYEFSGEVKTGQILRLYFGNETHVSHATANFFRICFTDGTYRETTTTIGATPPAHSYFQYTITVPDNGKIYEKVVFGVYCRPDGIYNDSYKVNSSFYELELPIYSPLTKSITKVNLSGVRTPILDITGLFASISYPYPIRLIDNVLMYSTSNTHGPFGFHWGDFWRTIVNRLQMVSWR